MALRTRIWPGRRPAAICVCLFFALFGALAGPNRAGAAGLADSPWPMFQHDPQHTGRGTAVAPSKLALKWRFQVEGQPGSPAIGADGVIYLPTGSATGSADAKGFLYAINPDGTLRWRFEFPPAINCVIVPGVTTPAVADDGTVYVHTQSGRTLDGSGQCTAGPSFLYAIKADGTEKWKYQLNLGAAVLQGSGISSPAIGTDGTVYVTSQDTGLHAVDPATGTFDWVVSPEATSITSSPAIGSDGTIYVNIFDLHAYEPDGDPLWTAEMGNGCCIGSSPTVAPDGTIYACGINPDNCHAVASAGGIAWTYPLRIRDSTSPALGPDNAIHLASGQGTTSLTTLNPDGTQRWQNTYSFGSGAIHHTPVIGGDGRIYARDDLEAGPPGFFGSVFVVNPDGIESDRETIPPTNIVLGELNPAIGADGTLYVPEPHAVFNYDPNDQYLAAFVQGADPPPDNPPPGGNGSQSSLTLGGKKLQRLDAAIEVEVRCDQPCRAVGTGKLIVTTPGGRTPLRATRKSFRLKKSSKQLAANRTGTLKLKLPARARGAAAKALRADGSTLARITVTARDGAGDATTKKRRVRLR